MTITAALVKELREKTGVGMMECKTALNESGGEMEKAILWLRERGMSRAAKKAGRATAEGLVHYRANAQQAVLVEINCETDFVAKNEDFIAFCNETAEVALASKVENIEEANNLKLKSGQTVAETLTALIAKIGENLSLRRFRRIDCTPNGIIEGYLHMGGKIGVLVAIEGCKDQDFAKDIAMHIAASAPRYLKSEDVPSEEIEIEKELARKKILEEGKPANMVDKILQGQINKFYKEVCLLEQAFVKDPKLSIAQLLTQKSATLTAFARFQLGEGVEKKQEDFAAEVAKLQS
jgi:elongation factor Ts